MEDAGCAALTVKSNTSQKQSTKTFDYLNLKKGRIYCRSVAKRDFVLIALYQFNPSITSLMYFFLFDRFSHFSPNISDHKLKKKHNGEMALYCTMCRLLSR